MTKLPKPLARVGRRKRGLAPAHRASRALVFLRVQRERDGRCEGCDKEMAVEWDHVAGRGSRVEEPYCSSPELTCGLCRRCHHLVTGVLEWDPDAAAGRRLRKMLQQRGAVRLAAAHHLPLPEQWRTDPMGAIRQLVRTIEERKRA